MASWWYAIRGGSEPASVSVHAEKVHNNVTVASEAVSMVVEPGAQSGCATFKVGAVAMKVDDSVI